jgi:hypothetical protein
MVMNGSFDSAQSYGLVQYGRAMQDYTVPIAVFIAAAIMAGLAIHFSKKAIRRWLWQPETVSHELFFAPLLDLFTYLLPLGAIALAKRFVNLDALVAIWVDKVLLLLAILLGAFATMGFIHGVIDFTSRRHIEQLDEGEHKELEAHRNYVKQIRRQTKAVASGILAVLAILVILRLTGVTITVLWESVAAMLIIAFLLICRIIFVFHRTPKPKEEIQILDGELLQEEVLGTPAEPQIEQPKGPEEIAQYFLSLYKYQLGVSENAHSESRLTDHQSLGAHDTYELRVRIKRDWTARRMTIGRLGEGSGSRSACFFVIYDDYRVIKFPYPPVRSFSKYIEILRKQKRISESLAPKICIIPKVSPVLRIIHPFPDIDGLSSEALEEKYIMWLGAFSNYQKYLKIDGSFVFFMDLSEGHFLSHIIEQLHDTQARMVKEITEHHKIIWDAGEFEHRYGWENLSLRLDAQRVYNTCETEVRALLVHSAVPSSVLPYQIQKWFMTHLAGLEIPPDESGLTPRFVAELNRLMKKILGQHSKMVSTYRKAVRRYVRDTTLTRYREQVEGIITNLLVLLAWLGEKRVAIRDLKPDNLWAAGVPGKYPLFLTSVEEYEIGLIDLETAVDFEAKTNEDIDQPLLGGTPFYATPSHFFENNILAFAFRDLANIFHLQDWHATLCMIYHLVTGDQLFYETSKLLFSMSGMIHKANAEKQNLIEVIQHVSKMFWSSALKEFDTKIRRNQKALESVTPTVPDNAREMLNMYVLNERQALNMEIQKMLEDPEVTDHTDNQQHLMTCSRAEVSRLLGEWEQGRNLPKSGSKGKEGDIEWLRNIERLKARSEAMAQNASILQDRLPKMSAYDLLKLMFTIVQYFMYEREWGSLAGDDMESLYGLSEAGREKTTVKEA